MRDSVEYAAALIDQADGLLITAGAGMGVDSGLPDFRGNDGFWEAYPALAKGRISFASIANPLAFETNPRLAWGFYGHRLALYRQTIPHAGFAILKAISAQKENGAFVATSNVDGQFQEAGFDANHILEIHGSIHYMQCCDPCREASWPSECVNPRTDEATCQWVGSLPTCLHCGRLARPNILMFDDYAWVNFRQRFQRLAYDNWTAKVRQLVVVECGAGVGIPSIRRLSESQGCPVIRINPQYPDLPEGMGVSLRGGALEFLQQLGRQLGIEKIS